MKEFKVKGKVGAIDLKLPTSIKELTDVNYFINVTNGIKLPDDHSIIALVYKETLSIVLNPSRKHKNEGTIVFPLFVRSGETQSDFIKGLEENTPVIVMGSDISRGYHLNCKHNLLSMPAVKGICEGTSLMTESWKDHEMYYFVDFKIIPNCDIHGSYPKEVGDYINPFITINEEVN